MSVGDIVKERVLARLEFADVKGMTLTPQVLAYVHRLVGWELDELRDEGVLNDEGARWKYEIWTDSVHQVRVTFILPTRLLIVI